MSPASPWWFADVHTDRRPFLLARGRLQTAVRGWFLDQGFTEVDTAALQVSPGNEAHLQAFATELETPDGSRQTRYLHTSPEFAMKKLLAAGETKIFTFARVYRNRERSALHHPEFTMLEWYRAGEGYEQLMADCAALLSIAADAGGRETWSFAGRSCDPRAAPVRLSLDQAFSRFAGFSLLGEAFREGIPDRDLFAAAATRNAIRTAADDSWRDIFSKILVERVEAGLAGRPPHPLLHGVRGRQSCVSGGQRSVSGSNDTPSQPLPLGRRPDGEWWQHAHALQSSAQHLPSVHPLPANAPSGQDARVAPLILDAYPACEAALARAAPGDPRVAERFELFACGVELANAFGEQTDPVIQRARLEEEMALKQQLYGDSYPIDEDFLAALARLPCAAGAALGFDRLAMLATGAERIEQVIWTPVA